MPETQSTQVLDEDKWKCGSSAYNTPERQLDAETNPYIDTWSNLSDSLKAQVEERCKAWDLEVQNLLVYAGLFSSAVTSFVLQVYTGLTDASPDPSTIRSNVFLFLSLILSLSTALIGIICLQWLREHLHTNKSRQAPHIGSVQAHVLRPLAAPSQKGLAAKSHI